MKLLKNYVLLLVLFFVLSCDNEKQNQDVSSKSDSALEEKSSNSSEKIDVKSVTHSSDPKVYQLKEDGVYIYSDSKELREISDLGCVKVVQKNYKYIQVPSSTELVAFEEGPKTYQKCIVEYECEDDFGKPSLQELGYERHNEREIKPEDNRFGVPKTKLKKVFKKESKLLSEVDYYTLPKSVFKELSMKEFLDNGIVIVGKHISRVVIKSLDNLPKWSDKVAVKQRVKMYDCSGKLIESLILPQEIADFKKIHFKENIFEFIVDEPIDNNSAYLSDEEFMKLTNDLHQLIPRVYDKTIHNHARYKEDYYIIEYYNGNVLYDYQCIKLSKKESEPKLWDKLIKQPPSETTNLEFTNEKCYLIIAEFKTTNEVKNYILNNSVGEALIYHLSNGNSILAVECESSEKAKIEMKRYINMGFKKENLRIEKF